MSIFLEKSPEAWLLAFWKYKGCNTNGWCLDETVVTKIHQNSVVLNQGKNFAKIITYIDQRMQLKGKDREKKTTKWMIEIIF